MFAIKRFLLLIVCLAILFLIAGTSIAGGLSFITPKIFQILFFTGALSVLIIVAINSRRARSRVEPTDPEVSEALQIVKSLMEKHGMTHNEALDFLRFQAEMEASSRRPKLFGKKS